MKYALVLDSGTTSVRAALVDTVGNIIDFKQEELSLSSASNSGIHQDGEEIYTKSKSVILSVLRDNHISNDDILGLGITNQRETTLLFDTLGIPLANAIVWQSKESDDICQQWIAKGYQNIVMEKTGLTIDAYFSASKIRYLLDTNPDLSIALANHNCLFGTVDTYLIYRFTQGKVHASDGSNASRTMLFNIHSYCWDDQLLELFDIPKQILPRVNQSIDNFGVAQLDEYQIPIIAVLGDQQAACLGDGCTAYGDSKVTYGTGGFVLCQTKDKCINSSNGMVSSIAWRINNQTHYVLEGSVFIAGAAIQWLRYELNIIDSAKDSEALACSVNDSEGVVVVPCFTGLGAPYWNGKAKAMIAGISRKTNKAHITYATLQAIANSIEDVLVAMRNDLKHPIHSIVGDGGASANDLLCQMQSDLSVATLIRYTQIEATLLGVAYLVLFHYGYISSLDDVSKLKDIDQTFMPQLDEIKKNNIRKQWKKALACVDLYANS